MASLSLQYPTPTRTATIRAGQSHVPLQNQPAQILHKSPLCLFSLDLNKSITRRRRRNLYLIKAIEDGKDETTLTNPSSSSSMTTDSNESGEKKTLEETSKEGDGDVELGVKIREAMKERESKENFWGGVREEIGEIEWPVFGKVLGITGVVLGVIAGSSVVLLTVNAVLAEVSDKVFAGRGLQDFFG